MASCREGMQGRRAARPFILLVDDEANQREMYQRRLERAGYQVRLAESAQAAIAAVQSERPEVVILDLAMPEADGLTTLHSLLSIDPSLPVIINTAYPAYADSLLARAAGAYLEKTIDLGPLLDAIERALAGAPSAAIPPAAASA